MNNVSKLNNSLNKIVITGPESTGKSTLCELLSKHYNFPYLKEQSRSYLESYGEHYLYDDLLKMAKLQMEEEDRVDTFQNAVIFCDTDLITFKIWSDFKYGQTDPEILQCIENRHYDLYLLCKPDIPWVGDPLRENPGEREILYSKYVEELDLYNKTFEIVQGMDEKRLKNAIIFIDRYLLKWEKGA